MASRYGPFWYGEIDIQLGQTETSSSIRHDGRGAEIATVHGVAVVTRMRMRSGAAFTAVGQVVTRILS